MTSPTPKASVTLTPQQQAILNQVIALTPQEPVRQPPSQAEVDLLDALSNVSGWREATTPGVQVAKALPGVRVAEYAALMEIEAAESWQTGIAWHSPAHGWCAIACASTHYSEEKNGDTYWDMMGTSHLWSMRPHVLVAGIGEGFAGPFPTALDLAQHLFAACSEIVEDSWYDDQGQHRYVPPAAINRVQPAASANHDLCPHLRAVGAVLSLMPDNARRSAQTVLALVDGPQAAAVQYLLREHPAIFHEP